MLDQEPVAPPKTAKVHPFLIGFLCAAALAVSAYYFLLRQPRSAVSAAGSAPSPAAIIAPSKGRSDAAGLAGVVAEEQAKLGIKPHTIELTTDRAAAAAEALRRGDSQAAETLVQVVLAQSKLGAFSFQPFSRFMSTLSLGDEPDYLAGINAWVSHSPASALAYLVRAKYFYDTAWEVRGTDFAAAIPDERIDRFRDDLARAADDIHQSIKLNPGIPWSYFLQLQISEVNDDRAERQRVFLDGISHFANYYPLYRTHLYYLQPKWGGPPGAMYEFVNHYAAKAPPDSPLNMLYMQLTANLLNEGWVDCRSLQHEALTRCMNAYMQRSVTGGVTNNLTKALNLYKRCDPIQYSNEIWSILGAMADTGGDTSSIDSMLQLTAAAMGSNNELIHDAGHNNYAIDDITARLWVNLDNTSNVEQKFKEALDDAQAAPFASEDDRDAALGGILEDASWAARRNSEYIKVIAYDDAANAVAGENREGTKTNKCFAYYQLHRYQETVGECTHLIDTHHGVLRAHYFRAWANEALRNYDAALAEYQEIADNGNENAIRAGAVINLGHINALRGNLTVERDIFEKYPFIFDTHIQAAEDLAIAYNNRCFVFMKLGDPRKALDDCNTSLRYGRLPDALHKQQELVKLLGETPG